MAGFSVTIVTCVLIGFPAGKHQLEATRRL